MGSKSAKLSLCMIVKNEAENLPKCLGSVRDVVDEIVVLDTGSEDDSIQVAQFFGAVVYELEWPNDFAIARNAALEHVTGDWVLVLDADESLNPEIVPALRQAIEQDEALVVNLIRHEIGAAQSPYSLVSRLFRRHPRIHFTRPYHAMIDDSVEALIKAAPSWKVTQLSGVAILHTGYQADVIQQQNKYERARAMMEQFLTEHPDDPYVCSKLGALYLQMNERERGLELLKRGLNATEIDAGTHYELLYHLGSAYAEATDLNQAAHYYQQAIRQPIDAKLKLGAMHNLATLMQNAGEYVMAAGLYQQVIQIDPNLTIAHYNLGMALKQIGQFTDAIEHYRHAIRLNPYYAEAHQNLGVVMIKIGNVPAALDAFQTAINLHKQQGNADTAKQLRNGLEEMGFQLN